MCEGEGLKRRAGNEFTWEQVKFVLNQIPSGSRISFLEVI